MGLSGINYEGHQGLQSLYGVFWCEMCFCTEDMGKHVHSTGFFVIYSLCTILVSFQSRLKKVSTNCLLQCVNLSSGPVSSGTFNVGPNKSFRILQKDSTSLLHRLFLIIACVCFHMCAISNRNVELLCVNLIYTELPNVRVNKL